MWPQVISKIPYVLLRIGKTVLGGKKNPKNSWSSKNQKLAVFFFLGLLAVHSIFALQSHCGPDLVSNKIWTWRFCSWVIVNKQLPRFAAALGGALCPGAVGAIPAGTSGCYSPPGRAETSCASAAGPELCWSGCSAGCCSPTLRGTAGSCRPWSHWRWGCAPEGPRRFCTVSWTWTSGSGTRF